MIKNRYIYLGLIISLVFLIILNSFLLFKSSNVVYAEQASELWFYESSVEKAVFSNTDNISQVDSLSLKNKNVSLSLSNIEINQSEIVLKNLPQADFFVEGETYELELVAKDKTYTLPFMYVTKVIRTAEDCKVFDVSTPDTNIYGYYVLANDLDLGDEVINKHDGLFNFDDPNYANDRGPDVKGGFWGTFNGLGHNLTFVANRGGFFGRIFGTTKIINTGFVDIKFKNTAKFAAWQEKAMPILARYFYSRSNYGLIKDCYFQSNETTFSGIISSGNYTDKLKIENILIEVGDYKSFVETTGLGHGVFIGHQEGTYFRKEIDMLFKDIYVISGAPLGVYATTLEPDDDYVAQLPDGSWYNRYIRTYATNRGIQENLLKGIRVFANIKQYLSYNSMSKDENNNFTSFNKDYWISSNQRLKWKNSASSYFIDFTTDAFSTSDNITLKLNLNNSVSFFMSKDGLVVSDVNLEVKMLEEYQIGGEIFTYKTDVVSISNDGTFVKIIPVKEGIGRVLVSCSYNGVKYEKTIKISVKESSLDEQGTPQTPSGSNCGGSSCASIDDNSSSNNGGIFMSIFTCLLMVGIIFVKRKVKG